uniref:Uncharacterized protein n=1 Tax=Magallana gigas TaxID=29159 RepID=A0A8W8MNW8_MAGGI
MRRGAEGKAGDGKYRAARLQQNLRSMKEEALEGVAREKLAKKQTFKTLKDKLEAKHKENLSPQHRRQLRSRRILDIPSKRTALEDCPKFIRREDEDSE